MEMWKDASQNEQYSVTARRFGQTKTMVYMCRCVCQSLSHVATLCDLMTPLSMEFSRQEYWSGQPFPSPVDLPDPGIKPGSPSLQVAKSGCNCCRAAAETHLCTLPACQNPCTFAAQQPSGPVLSSASSHPHQGPPLHPRPVERWARERVMETSQIA